MKRLFTHLRLAAAACGVAGAASCAAILGIDDGTPRDGGADAAADARGDAPDALARCNAQKPFNAPVAVAELDTGGDEALARLSRVELEVYFERITTSYDIFVATRSSAGQPFGSPGPVSTIDTPAGEADPTLSANGQLLFFASDREGGAGAFDLWVAPRADGGFGAASQVAGADSTSNEQFAYALANSLYFTSDRTGTDALYRADLAGTTATNAALVSPPTAGVQLAPVVSDDELLMYFGAPGVSDAGGDYDIWMATRTATSQPWSAPVAVSELNTTSIDVPSWLSPDLCRLYLSTNRGGNFDIYLATRSP